MYNYEQIESFDYVSFDLFDTLIFRAFSKPSGVFKYVEYLYNKKYQRNMKDFCLKRKTAEKKARKRKNWEEINLDEIYDELTYSDETKNILKDLEIQVEINCCIPNTEMINLAWECHDRNQKVIITTDMYLPRECIERIIKKCHIPANFIFISGEVKKTKIQGELFGYILNTLAISANQIIHIGDNEKSDFQNPLQYQIKSVQYIRKKEDFPYLLNKKNDILVDYYNNLIMNGYRASDIYSAEYKIGYSVMGPIMVEFCLWIHQIKEVYHIDKLFFLAREGYVIKQCYEEIYPQEKDVIYYIRLNKRVMGLPLLKKENVKDILLHCLKNHKDISWREILDIFGVRDFMSQKEILESFSGVDLNERVNVNNLDERDNTKIFEAIINVLQPIINNQSKLLEEYICSFDIIGKKIGLINNSYSGNGQALLTRFIEEHNLNCELLGLQFAGNKKCRKTLGTNFRTWIPNDKKNSLAAYLFERGSLIFEHLLFEPNGTSLRMMRDSQETACVVCEQPRSEIKDFDRIKAAQKGMTDFITVYKSNIHESVGFEVIGYFVNMIQKPEKKDAIVLGSLFDDDVDMDRQIIDFDVPLDVKYIYKNNIYNKISWVQGYLVGKDAADIYRKIFNVRLWLTNILHNIRR